MKKLKEKLKNATAGEIISFVCFLCAIIMIMVAFFTPPPFKIDQSVLIGIGELGIFSNLARIPDWIKGLKDGESIKIKKGDSSIEISNDKEEED